MSEICPGCRHAPHYGRCFFVATPPGRYVECQCKNRRQPHGTDSPASRDSRGPAVPVAEPRRELARLGGELAVPAEDVLARIREVGATMQDGAARLSEREYADATMRTEGARDTLPRWAP